MVAAMIAILKAGGAYVPIDPVYPVARRRLMLAGVKILLATRRLQSEVEIFGKTVIYVEDINELKTPGHCEIRLHGESRAYVMYTSGSTGNPKGVAIPHRGVVRLVRNTNYVELQPTDIVAQVANCCFDLATFEIWGALLNGARLVIVDRDVSLAPAELAREIRQRGITTLLLTTSVFNLVAREQPAAFAGVRYVLFAGEAADPHSVAAVLKQGAPQHLINAYGLDCETTTFALYHEVKEVPSGSVSIPIGETDCKYNGVCPGRASALRSHSVFLGNSTLEGSDWQRVTSRTRN